MSTQLAVAAFFFLCFTTEARAGPPWLERPAAFSTDEKRASSQGTIIGSAADYVQILNRPVYISGIAFVLWPLLGLGRSGMVVLFFF